MTTIRVVALIAFALCAQPLHAQTTVTGFVRDSAGRPLAGADVAIEALSKHATTDAQGAYRLGDIAPGLRLVRARMLGHTTVANLAQLAAGQAKTLDFTLDRLPQKLDTVVVKERKPVAGVGFAAFEERRSMGFGKFLDSTFLRKNAHRHMKDVMREIPQADVLIAPNEVCRSIGAVRRCYTLPRGMQVAASRRLANRGACLMDVFLDGTLVQPGSQGGEVPPRWERAYDLRNTDVSVLDGVEFYRGPGEAPIEFSASSECGVLILWSRRSR